MMRVPDIKTVETRACLHCGKTSLVAVDAAKLKRWEQGELIQRVWPEWDADERELLITGIHPECWTLMRLDEDE